jgi:Fe2+ transport system protein FeoA
VSNERIKVDAECWVRVLRPTYCGHCGAETEWEFKLMQGVVRAISEERAGTFATVDLCDTDFDTDRLPIGEVHLTRAAAEAQALRATAPEVTEALASFLGHPEICPRGNPIPAEDGSFEPLDGILLSEVEVGTTVRVLAVNATATDVLKYLQERNILPGRELEILEAAPMQGPLTLRVEKKEVALGLSLAEFVIVEPI